MDPIEVIVLSSDPMKLESGMDAEEDIATAAKMNSVEHILIETIF